MINLFSIPTKDMSQEQVMILMDKIIEYRELLDVRGNGVAQDFAAQEIEDLKN